MMFDNLITFYFETEKFAKVYRVRSPIFTQYIFIFIHYKYVKLNIISKKLNIPAS